MNLQGEFSQMMQEPSFDAQVAELIKADPAYKRDAYSFVCDAIAFAVKRLAERRHLSAAELVDALIELATSQYGPFAPDVLAEWGICGAADVGNVVYKLIGKGLLAASDDDSPEDFPLVLHWFEPQPDASEPLHPSLPKID